MEAFATWSRSAIAEREQIVLRFAAEVTADAHSLVSLLMQEVGKLRADAESEVSAVITKAQVSIDMLHARRGEWETKTSTGMSQIRYRPLGVVLVLGPFNFPAHLPGGHIIPALLAGNVVVFKPSELAPRVGQWLAEAWRGAGLPEGVLQLIQGDAEVARSAIADHRIAGVFFTGGYHTGVAIHRQLAGRPDVLLALEMGGNNPIVLVPPYDVHEAATLIVQSAFTSAGQRCTCARRLVVIDDEQGRRAIEVVVKLASEIKCGLPSDDASVQMGPVISAAAAERWLQTQQLWIAQGGCDRLRMTRSSRSAALVTPGIIDMTASESAADEEWFGPLLQVYRVRDFAAAISKANDTRYGLAAALIGGDAAMFETFRNSSAAGIVNWNTSTIGASSSLPFGGLGKSGNHRAAGAFAIDFCNDPVASLLANVDSS